MQIDFHHTVIYVLARLAGFDKKDADILSYSSQYVDDATCDDLIRFNNGAIYEPIYSSHKKLDYHNFKELSNHLVWVPFHFLPANCMKPAGKTKDEFRLRVICRPKSHLIQDMLREAINRKTCDNGLHRFGIALHTFADSWAHQGFSGIQSYTNTVDNIIDDEASQNLKEKVELFFGGLFNRKLSMFIDDVLPLGHAAVLSYPDKPYLKWRYLDFVGNVIECDNTEIYMEAVHNIFVEMKRFQLGNPDAEVAGLDETFSEQIRGYFKEFKMRSALRHQAWLDKIKEGAFPFGAEMLSYSPEGPGSWEAEAFLGKKHCKDFRYDYYEDFAHCNWKMFNDALQDHRFFMIRVLFPKYELIIA